MLSREHRRMQTKLSRTDRLAHAAFLHELLSIMAAQAIGREMSCRPASDLFLGIAGRKLDFS
jgi:hypothetical protein